MTPEIIIGIVSLFVALPPTIYVVWRFIGRRKSEAPLEAGKK